MDNKIEKNGFTLIELLVVIAVMAIIGTFTLANYRSFGEEANLKSEALNIQSLIRQAQTNATTNAACDLQYSSTWQVEFTSTTTVNLKCSTAVSVIKPLTFGANIVIDQISGNHSSCSTMFTINFAPFTGQVSFKNNAGALLTSCTSLTITLKNSQTVSTKDLKVEAGGRVYVQ